MLMKSIEFVYVPKRRILVYISEFGAVVLKTLYLSSLSVLINLNLSWNCSAQLYVKSLVLVCQIRLLMDFTLPAP